MSGAYRRPGQVFGVLTLLERDSDRRCWWVACAVCENAVRVRHERLQPDAPHCGCVVDTARVEEVTDQEVAHNLGVVRQRAAQLRWSAEERFRKHWIWWETLDTDIDRDDVTTSELEAVVAACKGLRQAITTRKRLDAAG